MAWTANHRRGALTGAVYAGRVTPTAADLVKGGLDGDKLECPVSATSRRERASQAPAPCRFDIAQK